jgi:hypothetical protein
MCRESARVPRVLTRYSGRVRPARKAALEHRKCLRSAECNFDSKGRYPLVARGGDVRGGLLAAPSSWWQQEGKPALRGIGPVLTRSLQLNATCQYFRLAEPSTS